MRSAFYFKERNMKLGKWTYEAVVVGLLIIVGLGIWWFIATKDERAADAQFERLVKFANRQQVEIAVIRQAAELQQLRAAIQRAQTLSQVPIEPPPAVTDPKDVPME